MNDKNKPIVLSIGHPTESEITGFMKKSGYAVISKRGRIITYKGLYSEVHITYAGTEGSMAFCQPSDPSPQFCKIGKGLSKRFWGKYIEDTLADSIISKM